MKSSFTFLLLSTAFFARAQAPHSVWCTASGISMTYVREVVWGADKTTQAEAEADALEMCRALLYQCHIVECEDRPSEESGRRP